MKPQKKRTNKQETAKNKERVHARKEQRGEGRARKGANGEGRARKGAEGEAASSAVAQGASRELASKAEQQTTTNSEQTKQTFSGPDGARAPGVALQQNPRVIDRMMAATMQLRPVSSSVVQRNFLFFESG